MREAHFLRRRRAAKQLRFRRKLRGEAPSNPKDCRAIARKSEAFTAKASLSPRAACCSLEPALRSSKLPKGAKSGALCFASRSRFSKKSCAFLAKAKLSPSTCSVPEPVLREQLLRRSCSSLNTTARAPASCFRRKPHKMLGKGAKLPRNERSEWSIERSEIVSERSERYERAKRAI